MDKIKFENFKPYEKVMVWIGFLSSICAITLVILSFTDIIAGLNWMIAMVCILSVGLTSTLFVLLSALIRYYNNKSDI